MIDTAKIENSEHHEIIEKLSETIRNNYVFPEVGEEIAKLLGEKLARGVYSNITDLGTLAKTLTTHIQEVNRDKHLRVWHRTEQEIEEEEKTKQNSNVELQAEYDLQARLGNCGIPKVEILKGNIGYIDIRQFYPASDGANTVIAAMNFVSGSDALIFDLRDCIGGSPDMVSFVCSYLFEHQVHLNDLYLRESDSTNQFWTLPYVPGKRFCNKPVYVLTSQRTFSAGEEFANDLKELKRAVLIGEPTKGGAHPGRAIRFHKHLQVFVSRGRAINPVSGTNWEGCGVEPDISMRAEEAFSLAYKLSLEGVLEVAKESDLEAYKALAEEAVVTIEELKNRLAQPDKSKCSNISSETTV